MSEELKPCPFCGSEDVVECETEYQGRPAFYVCCDVDACWASMAPDSALWDNEDGAIKARGIDDR